MHEKNMMIIIYIAPTKRASHAAIFLPVPSPKYAPPHCSIDGKISTSIIS